MKNDYTTSLRRSTPISPNTPEPDITRLLGSGTVVVTDFVPAELL